jgi:hypothetical protein
VAKTKEAVMRTLALFGFAALAFSLLVGGIELWWTRQASQQRERKAVTILHPFSRNRVRKVRYSFWARAQYHIALFFGFLAAAYVGTVLARTVYHLVVAHMF